MGTKGASRVIKELNVETMDELGQKGPMGSSHIILGTECVSKIGWILKTSFKSQHVSLLPIKASSRSKFKEPQPEIIIDLQDKEHTRGGQQLILNLETT